MVHCLHTDMYLARKLLCRRSVQSGRTMHVFVCAALWRYPCWAKPMMCHFSSSGARKRVWLTLDSSPGNMGMLADSGGYCDEWLCKTMKCCATTSFRSFCLFTCLSVFLFTCPGCMSWILCHGSSWASSSLGTADILLPWIQYYCKLF